MRREGWARLTVGMLALALTIAALLGRWANRGGIELHARMAETGGFMPSEITATLGEPLHLRLTSDDVMHGFAIGHSDRPAIDVAPGETTRTTLTFDRPGTYTFYCTRWCGPNHWRMRGTIHVRGAGAAQPVARTVPRYVALGLDLDAPHPAAVVPARRPSAARGAELAARTPGLVPGTGLRDLSPAAMWERLRQTAPRALDDAEVWDLVAFAWKSSTTPLAIEEGRRLYAANCAACHGETGNGRGVMADTLTVSLEPRGGHGHAPAKPADFTKGATMLGASSTLLEGKILRGGMGTGMPYWGPILTDSQIAALVAYLWTFQLDAMDIPAPSTRPDLTPHRH